MNKSFGDSYILEIIRVVKTCAYHSDMPYCPVILEIVNEDLQHQQMIGGKFLLYVYNKHGKTVYEKLL
jgi:hypothetical protein